LWAGTIENVDGKGRSCELTLETNIEAVERMMTETKVFEDFSAMQELAVYQELSQIGPVHFDWFASL
jgi:hypothetical protein